MLDYLVLILLFFLFHELLITVLSDGTGLLSSTSILKRLAENSDAFRETLARVGDLLTVYKTLILASLSNVKNRISPLPSPSTNSQSLKEKFSNGIVDPDDIEVSFDNFPYYLSETTKNVLISSTSIHLKHNAFARFVGDLNILSPRILISGPTGSEIYLKTLTMALAKHYGAKILVFESLVTQPQPREEALTTLSNICTFIKGVINNISCLSYVGMMMLARVVSATYYQKLYQRLLCRGDEIGTHAINELFEFAENEAKDSALIIFMKDIAESLAGSPYAYATLMTKLDNLPDNILVIGIITFWDKRKKSSDIMSHLGHQVWTSTLSVSSFQNLLNSLFPNKIPIQIPQDEDLLLDWKRQLDLDVEVLKSQANLFRIHQALNQSGFECPDLQTVCIKDQELTNHGAEKIIGWALSHHIMHETKEITQDSKLLISSESINYGLDVLRSIHNKNKRSKKSLKDVVTENKFEKRLLADVIPPNEIGVSFDDIGALENVKDTLKELIVLPLQRPEFFTKGHITKPWQGILLFGAPGTGKTMLAKAVATEAGANFINISLSSIISKGLGEGEKYAKAVFTLASKISPSVIFVDEVDSMLGSHFDSSENKNSLQRLKNEFMRNWDSLHTKDKENVLVLAATNQPFYLDEAVIKRLPRRLMVNLPDRTNRREILRVLLAEEELSPNFDLETVAKMTQGYSGRDLKNLCAAAAHRPIREILEQEKNMDQPVSSEDIRPLCVEDFRIASEKICGSHFSELLEMSLLIEWNNCYGEGGSGKKTSIPYFI